MSVSEERSFEIVVPTKLVAKYLASSIAHEYDMMSIDIKQGSDKKLSLYIDGYYVFTEPGE